MIRKRNRRERSMRQDYDDKKVGVTHKTSLIPRYSLR